MKGIIRATEPPIYPIYLDEGKADSIRSEAVFRGQTPEAGSGLRSLEKVEFVSLRRKCPASSLG